MAKTSDVTRPRKAAAPVPIEVRLDEPEPDTLRAIGGSKSDRFNNALIDAMVKTGWFPPGQSDEDRSRQLFVAVTGLQAFAPADEIEAMIAAQAMAAHHASMECSRRAMLADQPFEAAQGFRKAAANASRTFVELLSALDRKRGKGGQQVVRVEHVHVHQGGQAIVGNVQAGDDGGSDEARTASGDRPGAGRHHAGRPHRQAAGTGGEGGGMTAKSEAEPHASRRQPTGGMGSVVAIQDRSPLWRPHAGRHALQGASDAERPVQDARRRQHRPAHAGGAAAHREGPHGAWQHTEPRCGSCAG